MVFDRDRQVADMVTKDSRLVMVELLLSKGVLVLNLVLLNELLRPECQAYRAKIKDFFIKIKINLKLF